MKQPPEQPADRGFDPMWMWLAAAIASDVAATVGMRAGDGFHWTPLSSAVVCGYVFAFFALSKSLSNGMKVGVAYAVWGGLGIAAVAVLSIALFGESLAPVEWVSLATVVIGLVALKAGGKDFPEAQAPQLPTAADASRLNGSANHGPAKRACSGTTSTAPAQPPMVGGEVLQTSTRRASR